MWRRAAASARDQGPVRREQARRTLNSFSFCAGLCQHLPLDKPNQMPTGKRVWGTQPFVVSLLGRWARQRSGEWIFGDKQRTTSTKTLQMFNVWIDSGPIRCQSVPKAPWPQWGAEASGTQSWSFVFSVLWHIVTSVCLTKWTYGLQYLVLNKQNLTKWTNALRSFLVSRKETAEWRYYYCRCKGTEKCEH